jgi:hypothetical protein
MRMIAIVVAALVLVACENTTSGSRANISFAPTSFLIGAQFLPQTLPFGVVTSACAVGPVFTTGFDLLIVQTRPPDVFMDRVTLHLIDGSNVGASITFPRPQLNAMFGSTLVAGTRAFPFRPQFGCGLRRPRSIVADVVLVDSDGRSRNISADAVFQ